MKTLVFALIGILLMSSASSSGELTKSRLSALIQTERAYTPRPQNTQVADCPCGSGEKCCGMGAKGFCCPTNKTCDYDNVDCK